jgi:hypothetical protein
MKTSNPPERHPVFNNSLTLTIALGLGAGDRRLQP